MGGRREGGKRDNHASSSGPHRGCYYVQDSIFAQNRLATVRIVPPKRPATRMMMELLIVHMIGDDGLPIEAYSLPQALVGALIARLVPLGALVHSVRIVAHEVNTFKL